MTAGQAAGLSYRFMYAEQALHRHALCILYSRKGHAISVGEVGNGSLSVDGATSAI